MAKNWREVRAEAMALGRIDPQRVDNARKEIEQLVHTHQLAEVRCGVQVTFRF